MNRPCNDDVTQIFDWLYLGGVKNTRKTLPKVDIWYDFKCDSREPKNLNIPENLIVHHIPFDDGDLEAALPIWNRCFKEILEYKNLGKTVFISCYEGVSRSAVLTLWLCCEQLNSFEEAMKHLKKNRNIYPDKQFSPFIKKLKERYQ
ncbi:dual specificity protein phosphatase family protein [Bacillus thuringiensis]|uniref:Protein tyrosine phosphatase n=1 Tax=Bacillus thuringiensis TaxID=1428 RepID=A0A9X6ZQX8_BACTU|nr:dual specificity protein phosphatase [Bacillus thuringiensis]PFJ33169.1 protein tyrosine phosphatase [Bacillus thuringiensis]